MAKAPCPASTHGGCLSFYEGFDYCVGNECYYEESLTSGLDEGQDET